MKRLLLLCVALFGASTLVAQELFPDGTPIDKWFFDKTPVKQRALGDRYVVTDHGVERDSLKMQTKALQWVID